VSRRSSVEILFQSHHAQVSERIRERARVAVMKLGARLARAVHAVVRFEEDGPTRRVEIVLHALGGDDGLLDRGLGGSARGSAYLDLGDVQGLPA